MHCAGVPYKAVRDPGPPSWHALLIAKDPHESLQIMGGGGSEGGGCDGDGGGEDGGYI